MSNGIVGRNLGTKQKVASQISSHNVIVEEFDPVFFWTSERRISLSKHSYRIDLSMHHTEGVDFVFGTTYHYDLTCMRVVEEIS